MSKFIFIIITTTFLTSSLVGQCFELVWSDEFDGVSLDGSKWTYQTGGWNASNVQNCYTTSNVSVQNGALQIEAKYEPGSVCGGGTRDFTSGFVQTKNRVSWTYGKFEARIKVPASNSTWPAFWLSPQDALYGPWPQSGEIDIMEIKGHDMTTSYGNAHWGNSSQDKQQDKQPYNFGVSGADDWHVYGVEWRPGRLDFYIDDNFYGSIDNFDEPNATVHPAPFDIPNYLRLNMAVGGTYLDSPWDIATNGINQLPAVMEVDWVRVYSEIEGCMEDEMCNIVKNGDFQNQLTDWTLFEHGTASAQMSINNTQDLQIDIQNSSTSGWHLSLRQNDVKFVQGETYTVDITAYADTPRDIALILSKIGGNQYFYKNISLTQVPTNQTFSFAMNDLTDENGILNIAVGGQSSDVYISNINIGNSAIGMSCDDGDNCTVNDTISADCICVGEWVDEDMDGVCSAEDPDDTDQCVPIFCESQCETVQNWDFSNGVQNWILFTSGNAVGMLSVDGDTMNVDITQVSQSSWHLSLRQAGLLLENGKSYVVRIDASADTNRSGALIISKTSGEQYAYFPISLTPEMSTYAFRFDMESMTDQNAVLNIALAKESPSAQFNHISISDITCLPEIECPDHAIVTFNGLDPLGIIRADKTISSSVLIDRTTMYIAGEHVILQPGFTLPLGVGFEVNMDHCKDE